MAITVQALSMGFHGGQRRRPGAIFTLTEGHKPSKWMKVVGETKEPEKVKAAKPKPAKEPSTFSELGKSDPVPKNPELA